VSRVVADFDQQEANDDRVLTPAEVASAALREAQAAPPVQRPPSPAEVPARPSARLDHAAPVPPAREMRVGVWSDGSIAIERHGRVETYSPTETAQLMRFFDRFLLRGRDAT